MSSPLHINWAVCKTGSKVCCRILENAGNHAYTEGIRTLQLLGAVDKFVMPAEFAEKSRRIDQAHWYKLSLNHNSSLAPSKEKALARLLALEATSL